MKDKTTKYNFSLLFLVYYWKMRKVRNKNESFQYMYILQVLIFMMNTYIYMNMTIYVIHHLFCIYNLHIYVYAYKTKLFAK